MDCREMVTHDDAWILTGYNSSFEALVEFFMGYQHCGHKAPVRRERKDIMATVLFKSAQIAKKVGDGLALWNYPFI